MGLDAYVRCNCYEKGLCRELPIDKKFIIYDNGELEINCNDKELEYELISKLIEWEETCCSHEDREYYRTRVSNWYGVSRIKRAMEILGEDKFPILLNKIPSCNGGILEVDFAEKALEELEIFKRDILKVYNAVLVDIKNNRELYQYSGYAKGYILLSGKSKRYAGFDLEYFYVDDEVIGKTIFKSKHFTQKLINEEEGIYQLQDVESGEKVEMTMKVGDEESGNEFKVISRKYKKEDFKYIIEALEKLLNTAIEVGNDIIWS